MVRLVFGRITAQEAHDALTPTRQFEVVRDRLAPLGGRFILPIAGAESGLGSAFAEMP